MLKAIKRFFSKPERAHRARARTARRVRTELIHLYDVRAELEIRESKLVQYLDRIHIQDLAHSLPERRARGW